MTIPAVGNGYQSNDGNLNEVKISVAPVPTTAVDNDTLTAAQITNGIILGSPTTTASYTLPTVANLELILDNAKVGVTFDFRIINVTGSGVITVVTNTGWSIGSQGLMTVAATAGTVRAFRARKSGDAAWALYAIS